MPKQNGTVESRDQIAEGTWAFHLKVPGRGFSYKPGQTIDITLPKLLHPDDSGNKRTFSIAAAPAGERLLIATRVRGSGFKRTLVEEPLGSPLEIEGPFGSFTLPNRPTKIVMLAGGIGVTPFRAMTEDVIARRLEHPLTLVHSNRTPEEAPFLSELQGWDKVSPRFTYVPTMTQADRSRTPWKGERRRVGPELLGDVVPGDQNEPLYYVAGPERFVKGMVDALKGLDVDEDRIRAEEFPGY